MSVKNSSSSSGEDSSAQIVDDGLGDNLVTEEAYFDTLKATAKANVELTGVEGLSEPELESRRASLRAEVASVQSRIHEELNRINEVRYKLLAHLGEAAERYLFGDNLAQALIDYNDLWRSLCVDEEKVSLEVEIVDVEFIDLLGVNPSNTSSSIRYEAKVKAVLKTRNIPNRHLKSITFRTPIPDDLCEELSNRKESVEELVELLEKRTELDLELSRIEFYSMLSD